MQSDTFNKTRTYGVWISVKKDTDIVAGGRGWGLYIVPIALKVLRFKLQDLY